MKKIYLTSLLSLLAVCAFADTEKDLCVFRQGVVMFETPEKNVDSTAVVDGTVLLFDSLGNKLYESSQKNVDSILFLAPVPKADILDVKFNADGSAEDISPMHNKVVAYGSPQTFFSNRYGRYQVRFTDNAWGGTCSRYYKIDYANNPAFQNALSNGHTMEAVIRCRFSGTIADCESKWFSNHQSGGTGMMISKISDTRKNELTFLPYVGGSYRWATSGIVPVADTYYHVVGVWNQSLGRAYIYVNGQLKNTVATNGSFKFPSSTCYYFSIGGDPSNATTVNQGWNGDVVVARIYDAPLNASQVSSLWNRLQELQGPDDVEMITNLKVYSGLKVKPGNNFDIFGTGFKEADKIVFTDTDDASNTFTVTITPSSNGASFNLPAQLKKAIYRMKLVRGNQVQDLGSNELIPVEELPRGAKVIAHRGYWKAPGAAQNSRASLQAALNLKECYGSETDVWVTTDGHLMVNHDASLSGVTIQTSTYDQVKNLTLSNGEKIPQLQDFLNMMATDKSDTKLIIEVKSHSTVASTCRCVDSVVAQVKAMGLQDRVEYIAFSYDACLEFLKCDPNAKVAYLNGGKSPSVLHVDGLTGLDYTQANTLDAYITQAHALGMTINVWTIDTEPDIIYTNNRDADYVTTNYPESALSIYHHYKNNR